MATANDGFDALIREAERAAGLAALLPDLRKLKSTQAMLDEAKSKAAKEERRTADLAAANDKTAADLVTAQKQLQAKQAEIATAAKANDEAVARGANAAKAQADSVVAQARGEADRILKDATARAAGLVTDAETAVAAKQREIDALNAAIAKLNTEHVAQAGKLAQVQRQREELRRSL